MFSISGSALPSSPPTWNHLANRFPDERGCLVSFLALEGAEVLGGVKPGNLVNIANRTRPCGQNPYALWQKHRQTVLEGSPLESFDLLDRGDSLLLYLYRRDLLQVVLDRPAVVKILGDCGYQNSRSLATTLEQLRSRVTTDSFPHEIGIFLGYPLKDVLAFMGRIDLPYACQGPWKIYGRPEQSLELADRFRECRCRMASRLWSCADPTDCLLRVA